ncbi:MAG: hypothetical protein ABR555_14085 [Pyrinomonadaceae bacterium]
MDSFDRREFLSIVTGSAAAVITLPIHAAVSPVAAVTNNSTSAWTGSVEQADKPCWLDLCVPFVLEDADRGLHAEVVLTSDTFIGSEGYVDGRDATDYEFYLYDAGGSIVGSGNRKTRISVAAMRTTVIPIRELIAPNTSFCGGMSIRVRPNARVPMHASDLFSSAFIRWQTEQSFDNVHANPDPLQWQKKECFYYSMPFPSLNDYECTLGVFNPYDAESSGQIVLHDHAGNRVVEQPYDLKPRASLLFELNRLRPSADAYAAFGLGGTSIAKPITHHLHERHGALDSAKSGGMLVVTNKQATTKSFAYLIIKRNGGRHFSVEHPIHQPVTKPLPAVAPFDTAGKFKARNILYSPLLFRAKRIGDITLESRFHLSTGLPFEEILWFAPYAVDDGGSVAWLASKDQKLTSQLEQSQVERGAIRLGTEQSCILDFARLTLNPEFSGGLCLAIAPDSTHTFMKVEVRVPEWGAHAFTHFRPGLRAARAYQKPEQRAGLMTDYMTSDARFERTEKGIIFDELIGVINIDDRAIDGSPVLELFGPSGLWKRVALGAVPAYACRHFLLSELIKDRQSIERMTMRLVDDRATLLMSTVHLDYMRRDIALDHGSDRFSTYNDYGCDRAS